MFVKLDAKRRLRVPAGLAPVEPGDRFEATFDAGEDTISFRRLPRKQDWLEVLQECPVPMDDLPPRGHEAARRRAARRILELRGSGLWRGDLGAMRGGPDHQ